MRGPGSMLATLAVVLFAGCGQPDHGPGEIVWGRDVCEHCQMAISDIRDAAQLRSAHDRRLHYFDDLGCAMMWQESQTSAQRAMAEVWVANPSASGWSNGATARFTGGHPTPMNHGFRVSEALDAPNALDLDQVREHVIERERERRSTRR